MTNLTFAPATRSEAKARVAIIGPTGAGKTWTALEWATVLAAPNGKIAVIDTENGSASLYSDQYHFDTAYWAPPYSALKLAAAIGNAAANYDVVVIDSLTHFWQGAGGVLDVVDRAAEKARGNTYAGWKEGTPVWRALLDALVFAPCHIVVTMRSKMDYVQDKDSNGKTTITKVGMAPVARNDVEYEFTVVGDMDQTHRMTITKSRCDELADQSAQAHQTQKLAVILRDWLGSADTTAPAMVAPQIDTPGLMLYRRLGEAMSAATKTRLKELAASHDRRLTVGDLDADADWLAAVAAVLDGAPREGQPA